MRRVENPQMELGQLPIDQIRINLKSRDDIPELLLGLQHLYTTPELREEVFTILGDVLPDKPQVQTSEDTTESTPSSDENSESAQSEKVDSSTGRPGMDQWRILVLGTLRLA
jgi:hypothetical protein